MEWKKNLLKDCCNVKNSGMYTGSDKHVVKKFVQQDHYTKPVK